jgi:hypothetical protein
MIKSVMRSADGGRMNFLTRSRFTHVFLDALHKGQ